MQHPVEFAGRFQVAPERLFYDQPALRVSRELFDLGQAPGDRAEEARRAGQVVKARPLLG
ncbi:MAG: hypothetical protein F4Y46_07735 [Chloroflexi bacterium]|nr:hypothetical protein [Chloroflexota bacterium]